MKNFAMRGGCVRTASELDCIRWVTRANFARTAQTAVVCVAQPHLLALGG